MSAGGAILYPQVTSIGPVRDRTAAEPRSTEKAVPGEFDRVLESQIGGQEAGLGRTGPDLGSIRQPLKFSAHASERMQSRNIRLAPEMMAKVADAVDRAEAKGIDDTLILTKDAALIVNVRNRTVVTAMDREQLTNNVFTNIDGAVIL